MNSSIDDHKKKLIISTILVTLLTVLSQLSSVIDKLASNSATFVIALLTNIAVLSTVTLPLVIVGLKLGTPLGLGAKRLYAFFDKNPDFKQDCLNDIKQSFILGISLGIILVILRELLLPYLPPEIPELGHRGVVDGLLVSISAAIGEEVWFRLGLMTIFVWVLCKLTGKTKPTNSLMWTTIILAGLFFGLAHLPQLNSYNAATQFAIVMTIMGNMIVSIAYGWFYWKRSLFAAICAHFAVDLVLHVLTAI